MSETNKVVFSGELQPGFDPDQVKEVFSKKFGLSPEKTEMMFSANREVVLKGGLNGEMAEKYKHLLEKMGLVVRIEGEQPKVSPSALALEPMEGDEGEQTLVLERTPAGPVPDKCPQCGSEKMENGVCLDCGVVAEKYLALQAHMVKRQADKEQSGAADNPGYSKSDEEPLEAEEGEMTGPERVSPGHGLAWIVRGWWHFKSNPFAWILAFVVWILMAVVVSLIPILGPILVNLAMPVVSAGFVIGCRAQDDGEDFSVGHVFAGFSNNAGTLVLVGVIYFGLMFLLIGLMMAASLGMMGMNAEMMEAQDPAMLMAAAPGIAVAVLFGTLLMIPVMMAYIFAPALVVLNDMKAIEAMKLSFIGCMKNLLSLTVFSLLAFLLMFIGSIPFGLGLLLVMPILTASLYAAYQDIYYPE